MSVGIQVIIVVFDDNKIIVVVQCVIGIDDVFIGGCDNSLFFIVCNIDIFIVVFCVVKVFDNFVISWLVLC